MKNIGITYGGATALEKRLVNSALIGIPFLGSIYAIFYFQFHPISSFAVSQLILWYTVSGIGVGVGLHRLFTHKSFQTSSTLRLLFGIAGSLAFQGSVIRWVAEHRRHHKYTDQELDTHSPYRLPNQSLLHKVQNFCHAHIGFMFDNTYTHPEVYAPDLMNDPVAVWLTNWYPFLTLIALLLPYGLGYIYGGSEVAIQCLLLGGFVPRALLHQVIWSINSIGHIWGARPSTTDNYSTNNWLLAITSFGEGWHNNHHAAPSCADLNWTGWQIDVGGMTITILEKLRLVWDVNKKHPIITNNFRKINHGNYPFS